jgi:hypothetical protein
MRKLDIPEALEVEFATVETLWNSDAETRRVDALALSWIKYEKQLRRLFSFFVFQHAKITRDQLDAVIAAFAENHNLYPETFISAIKQLGVTPLPNLLGDSYTRLWPEIKRIKRYRNKIMHGQNTGENIKSPTLERDVLYLVEWISLVAEAAKRSFGYDGLKRNTFAAAKNSATAAVQTYPFSTPSELKSWLSNLKH